MSVTFTQQFFLKSSDDTLHIKKLTMLQYSHFPCTYGKPANQKKKTKYVPDTIQLHVVLFIKHH